MTNQAYTNTTEQMIEIDYSDSTPDVSFTFDQLGRQKTITDARGARTFYYDEHLALTNETTVGVECRIAAAKNAGVLP